MNAWQRNSYINHMDLFAKQPLKIFDSVAFFYDELSVEESKDFINPVVKFATMQEAKDHGIAMHNTCMPMRLTYVDINAVMKVVTFDDKHIKFTKKGK